jgi:hypothetical protein
MSRSNPTENTTPHPSTLWAEWDGSNGALRYYDKESKANVLIPDKFTMILLDQLSCINGWSDSNESGIYSNEIRNIGKDILRVSTYSGKTIAEGIYKSISPITSVAGGKFTANLYIAYKSVTLGKLAIGSIKLKGAALSSWLEFAKTNKESIYAKAVVFDGCVTGKKGAITFKTPHFELREISEQTNLEALNLDVILQTYLKGKLTESGTVSLPAEAPKAAEVEEIPEPEDDDDILF